MALANKHPLIRLDSCGLTHDSIINPIQSPQSQCCIRFVVERHENTDFTMFCNWRFWAIVALDIIFWAGVVVLVRSL
jgi:hypothetical protein